MEKTIISCLESRVETNRSIYARFLLGPFKDDQAVTIATALRRSLLSQVKSIAITAIHIQGVTHEFSTIAGVRESVLDLALNFQQVVLCTQSNKQALVFNESKEKSKIAKTSIVSKNQLKVNIAKAKLKQSNALQNTNKKTKLYLDPVAPFKEAARIGYLQVRGPKVIYANDLKLPVGVECVDPTQYIATLSTEGLLVVKFVIGEKRVSFENNKEKLIANLSPDIQNGYENIAPNELLYNRSLYKSSFHASQRSLFNYGLNRMNTQVKVMRNKASLCYANNAQTKFVQPLCLADAINVRIFDSTISLRNTIFLDPIFDSICKVNYLIEKDDLFNQPRERILLELWTNGSIHPRQALHKASLSLISTFSIFRNVFHLDSL